MSGQPVTMPSAESLAALAALRERQLRAVLQISEATHSKTNLDDLIRDCLQVALDTADASAGSVILYDPKKEKLVFTYVIGPAAPMLTGLELAPDQGICGQVFQTGQPLITDDPTKEQRHL
ncbi:MAG: GAF domain-containing protein, partial [Armatimonadetes bacterium]|nr:GAF domain-containing protein [Armatimonadota bacterium]